MAWQVITDGDDGLAAPVMDNLKWVGRMGLSSFYPLNASGAYAVQNLGETGKEWGNFYMASGKKIYIGGVEFKGGGGGGGLETLELKSHFEKQGINYPISAELGLNESFTNNNNVVLTLREAYTAASATMVVDINKTLLDAMDATTGWADGAGAGGAATVAQDTTAGHFTEGTGSVKFSRAAQNGVIQMVKTFAAFSVVDTLLSFTLYVDTVSSLTRIFITLESTAGNSKTYYVPVANISAATLTHISIDPTNDTADASAGTFVPSSVTKIYFGSTTSGAQTVVTSIDYIVTAPSWILPMPYSLYIWDGTNQERLAITSVAGTGNHQRRTYTITALSNSYTVAAAYAKERNVTISGNQGIFPTGLAGAVALTVYDQTTKFLDQSVSGKTLNMSQRFWDEEYKINTLSSTTETKITVASDIKAYFKSGDKVIMYHKKYSGRKYESTYNATVGANFMILTLTSDSTYSAPSLTLTHTGEVNTGADTSEWYVVRYSAEMLYLLEAANANGALSTLTPTIFLPDQDSRMKVFSDNFNRGDGAPANDWTATAESNVAWAINTNTLYLLNGASSCVSRCTRVLEGYGKAGITYDILFDFISTETGTDANNWGDRINCFADPAGTGGTSGIGVMFKAGNDTIVFYNGSTILGTFATTITAGTQYSVRLQISLTEIKSKFWATASTEPSVWDQTYKTVSPMTNSGNAFVIYGKHGLGMYTRFDNLVITSVGGGYITRGSVDNLTGVKFTTGTKLTRSDSTNQNPIIYQRDALLS